MSSQMDDLWRREGPHKDKPRHKKPPNVESSKKVPVEKQSLLGNQQPNTSKQQEAVPKATLLAVAVRYLDWLQSLAPGPEERIQSQPSNRAVDREVELIQILRQECPSLYLDRKQTEIGLNEEYGTVFLLVRFCGTMNQKGASEKIQTVKQVRVQAAVFLKVDGTRHCPTNSQFILDEKLLRVQMGIKCANRIQLVNASE